MLTTVSLNNNTLSLEDNGYAPNRVFHTGQKIIYEGEEAQIIRLSPFPVVKTSNRVICGALLGTIEWGESSLE